MKSWFRFNTIATETLWEITVWEYVKCVKFPKFLPRCSACTTRKWVNLLRIDSEIHVDLKNSIRIFFSIWSYARLKYHSYFDPLTTRILAVGSESVKLLVNRFYVTVNRFYNRLDNIHELHSFHCHCYHSFRFYFFLMKLIQRRIPSCNSTGRLRSNNSWKTPKLFLLFESSTDYAWFMSNLWMTS